MPRPRVRRAAALLAALLVAGLAGAAAAGNRVRPCGDKDGCPDADGVCCQRGAGHCCPGGYTCTSDDPPMCLKADSLVKLRLAENGLENDKLAADAALKITTPDEDALLRVRLETQREELAKKARAEKVRELEDRASRLKRLAKVADEDFSYLREVKKGVQKVFGKTKAMFSVPPPPDAPAKARQEYTKEFNRELAQHERAAKLLRTAYEDHERKVLALVKGHLDQVRAHRTVKHRAGIRAGAHPHPDEARAHATSARRRHPLQEAHGPPAEHGEQAPAEHGGHAPAAAAAGPAAEHSEGSEASGPSEASHPLTKEEVQQEAKELLSHLARVQQGVEAPAPPEVEVARAAKVDQDTKLLAAQQQQQQQQQQ